MDSGDQALAARAAAALAVGDLVAAYDLAGSVLAQDPSSEAMQHIQVLALARMGDVEGAHRLFETFGLSRSADPHRRAAGARLLKDRALKLEPGSARQAAFERAHRSYLRIYRESGDFFPGINVATLALLVGRPAEGAAVATELLAMPDVAAANDYYTA